ncbi:hypothetical protein EPUS_09264 [Endocarpon pusillum Z07020]|uniref:Uncharacterized protein n=1 Tax=Endocarpon pusillum (strain Z07020 / HMAS-L-300199) TaxID=1263415 RepID=U1HNQ2_ENDPU|nr:uncharacterized protein EPUS_09264 [Endocarpon pusillum Z07020]ERF72005.1 hypothetical protein EPUS_09264 [Endocarpon pusillum Z07020]
MWATRLSANRGVAPEERLTQAELWQGVKRGARHPGEFAAHVQSCTVLSGGSNAFVREIVIGDGGVHAKNGKSMIQEVFLQDHLYLLATTRESGAKTTMMVGYGCDAASQEEEELDPYLSLYYELVMGTDSPEPGSQAERDIINGYRSLAKQILEDSVRLIRTWKMNGRLQELAKQEKEGTNGVAAVA